MNKYKVGDKVVLTVTSTNEMGCLPCYVLNDDLILSKQDIDKYTEPLSNYTEPLERKNENKEPAPKLTKREREFLESFEHISYKEIFRNGCGLYVNSSKREYALSISRLMFPFIKQGETWTFADLLKLEVEK